MADAPEEQSQSWYQGIFDNISSYKFIIGIIIVIIILFVVGWYFGWFASKKSKKSKKKSSDESDDDEAEKEEIDTLINSINEKQGSE